MFKRLLISLAAVIIALSASAEFRWGPTAGINISTVGFRQDLFQVDHLVGAEAGVIGEMMFPGIGFGMDFGLNWSMHGGRLHLDQREVWSSEGYGVENAYVHTLSIPVNLRFKYTNLQGTERYIAPFVYGGPIFAFNVGHSKLDCMEYPAGSVMLQCGIGAELFEKFQVSGGYYWGMTYEMRTRLLENFSAKPQGWTVKLTYLF